MEGKSVLIYAMLLDVDCMRLRSVYHIKKRDFNLTNFLSKGKYRKISTLDLCQFVMSVKGLPCIACRSQVVSNNLPCLSILVHFILLLI